MGLSHQHVLTRVGSLRLALDYLFPVLLSYDSAMIRIQLLYRVRASTHSLIHEDGPRNLC